ncbi:MAG: ATP synthase F1 subunit delta [Chloroflexi bacterium]|nr:ATP synthase F1 subunit delta [Chloroflexota bacterium]
MAKASVSARRYAQAVFQLALERNEVAAWTGYTQAIADAFSDPEVAALMASLNLAFSEKEKLLANLLPAISPLAMNLAKLLVSQNMPEQAEGIARAYQEMSDAHQGIERAEAVTAVPLEAAEQDAVRRELEQSTGKRVILTTRVDPSLVGGIIVQIGGKVLDGSVRSRLQGLKKRLEHASA